MKKLLVLLTAFALAVLPACSCNGDPPAEHTHAYSPVVTAPTCGLGGYTTFACICGKTYVDDYTERLGHEYEDGICIRCGSAQPVPHVHDYEKTVVAADCLNGGTVNGVCKICGARYIENLAPLGHSYDNGVCTRCGHFNPELHAHEYTTTVTEPDCINQGYTTYTCACGHSYNENIDALGHSYDNGVCIRCGHFNFELHAHEYTTTVTEPDCINQGYTTYTCACGHSYNENIDALGHSYDNGECTRCGVLKGSEGLEYTLSDDGTYYICSGIGTVTDNEIIIAADYNGKPVKAVADYAFRRSKLNAVTIPDGITSIGRYSFEEYCGENIRIPDSVLCIGDYAFEGSRYLTSISIGNGLEEIGEGVFADCNSVREIIISEQNKTFTCRGNCIIETQSKTVVAGFVNSVIPDDGSVTAIGDSAFYFVGLRSINIPYGVTVIGNNAFWNCFYLTEITLPDSIVSIGFFAFTSCKIASVFIPASVTYIASTAFWLCKNLESITVDEANTAYKLQSGCLIEISSKKLIFGIRQCIIPDDGSVTTIGFQAFAHNEYLTELIIPKSVEIIENGAFSYCINLERVTISGGVKTIARDAFYACEKLTDINFEGTMEQWNKIEKAPMWGKGLVIHCTDGEIKVT